MHTFCDVVFCESRMSLLKAWWVLIILCSDVHSALVDVMA